ncbi:MAG: GerMN domain-containing protein, partial [Bacillota bacterium]
PQGELAQSFAPSVPITASAGSRGLVRSLAIRDGIAYVDFEKDVLDLLIPGTEEISMALDAIVLTLTEFPEITKVQFMVAGKVMAVKIGALNLGTPFTRPRWVNPS